MKKTKSGLREKKFYTTYEAGDMLFVSHSTVIEWIKAGRIKATKTLGGHRRIPRDELHSFIRRNRMEFAGTKQARILVTDDDETIRAGLKETLESRGFEVYAAADGFEAGIMAIQKEPNLIILDLKMRGLDGFSACNLIKTNPLLKNTKILVLTGYPSKDNVDRILRLGADRCLAKPAEIAAVLKEVHELLGAEA